MTTWNLRSFYTDFDSPEFLKDFEALALMIDAFEAWRPITAKPIETILDYLDRQEAIQLLRDKLLQYCELSYTVDTSHPKAQKYLLRLEDISARTTAPETAFISFLGALSDFDLLVVDNPRLKSHSFFLSELRAHAGFLLSPPEEILAARLKTSGSSAWELMHSQITAELMIPFHREGTETTMTLSEIRGMASHQDSALRKQAYHAELAAYPAIAAQSAFSLNAIKGEVLTLGTLRGFESPLAEALLNSRMKPDTLNAMITAIEDRLPALRSYLKRKAALLGHGNGLPFYDLFAPIGDAARSYDIDEAKTLILSVFSDFSPDLAAFAENAFTAAWVDWLPRKGKVGGAFCSYSHALEESRILLNFTGSLDDITTLAHELGHGYHDAQLVGESVHNTHYPMPLAETASIFCETLMANALINQLSPAEQLGIRELRLQMISQVLIDIYCRFIFEQAVFNQRREFTLQPEELNSLMLDCQKKAYGDGLDPDFLHPGMWICKSHYYNGSLSYYNFPYAFGLLFATGLYGRFQEEGQDFIPVYRALLQSTGKLSVEAVAASAGMDLTGPAFWNSALDIIQKEIEIFNTLEY